MDGWIEYVILVVLVLINAFFAASELAIVSTRKTRIKQLADDGNRGARSVLRLSDNPRRFLATIQVGVTLAGFFASAFGAVSLVRVFNDLLLGFGLEKGLAGTLAFILVTVLIAFITLIFGELVPKTLAVEAAEPIALAVARPIEFIAKIAAPIVAFLTGTTNLIVRLLGGKRKSGTPTVTQEEVVSMVSAGQEEGVFQPQQEELIKSVFDFSEKRVREVMVPRPDMTRISADLPLSEAAALMIESDYSRYPVYQGDNDNIVGVVFNKDALRCYVSGQAEITVAELIRPAYFVPESKFVSELFTELQKSRTHLAIVVDEYGSVAGLVTLEDLLEELVGEIQDEFDHEESNLTRISDTEFVVSGRATLHDLNQELGFKLDEDENGERLDVDTIAGLVIAQLGHIPQVGETTRLELPRSDREDDDDAYPGDAPKGPTPQAVHFKVLEMDGLRINKLDLTLEYLQDATAATDGSKQEVETAPPAIRKTGS